ncbi:PREDICTED: cell growth regulator with EF hand domain protein 1 [Elephantulus edwardii]|uniref:cell growth regulator with EF hand domain protein 1 n=1 Tax=Elephantulus edwardii TaxID=28737 RepID=UPI0003F0BD49|nr:PREDICTED: cell growth regulator with EF hand domain protein 1 [Elephantulus edwardii]
MPPVMRVLALFPLLLSLGQAAPKEGATRHKIEELQQPLPNPFMPGEEQLRLLQRYLKGLERMEEAPEHMDREQVLLYVFALHDYDQSGQLDGLELLSMLTAALAPEAADSPPTNPVILVVDKVLETQDVNGDGLLTPAELINLPGEAPKVPPAPALQDTHASPRQAPLANSPDEQERPGALSLSETGELGEATVESLEPVQEVGEPAMAEAEALGPGEEAGGQVEVEEVPGPGEEDRGQVEAKDTVEEAEVLPGGSVQSQDTAQTLEAHAVQLENDEI